MAVSIKLFQTLRKLYKTKGLDIRHQLHTPKNLFQFITAAQLTRFLFFIIPITQLFISSTAFFLVKAQTPDEYGTSFYVSLTTLCVIINFLIIAWRMVEILDLIIGYEKFIEKSQF